MAQTTTPFLTYIAQVRQLHFKSAWLRLIHVPFPLRILLIKMLQDVGTSHKGIATIGIVRAVVWDEQSKNMDAWYQVAGHWLRATNFTSSPSPVGEGR